MVTLWLHAIIMFQVPRTLSVLFLLFVFVCPSIYLFVCFTVHKYWSYDYKSGYQSITDVIFVHNNKVLCSQRQTHPRFRSTNTAVLLNALCIIFTCRCATQLAVTVIFFSYFVSFFKSTNTLLLLMPLYICSHHFNMFFLQSAAGIHRISQPLYP